MTKDEIIPSRTDVLSMAREAGGALSCIAEPLEHPWKFSESELICFAALIASRVAAKASAASASVEREACAQVCDEYSAVGKIEEFDRGWLACAKAISNIIRARGQS